MTVIETQTKPRDERELEALEAVWNAPAAQTEVRRKRNLDGIRRPLGFAWGAVLLSLFLAPAPEQQPAIPWWSWALLGVFTVAVLGMFTVFTVSGLGFSLGASVVAGALGVALGLGCLSTEHHPGGWAIYEIAAFSALTLASGIGLAARRAAR
jgi:hypothetical protein